MGDRTFEANPQKSRRFALQPQQTRGDRSLGLQSTLPQLDIVSRTGSRTQSSATANTHAKTIRRLQTARSPLARQALKQLQRQYGNRYVQRVVELARQSNDNTDVAPEIEAAIERKQGSGQALDNGVRHQMESAFGVDFRRVNIHTDTESDLLNRSLEARAFTVGSDIFFSQGEYAPGSSSGRELLAHELTHVVQQSSGVRRKLTVSQPDDPEEREADRIATAIEPITTPPSQQASIQRQTPETEEATQTEPQEERGTYIESRGRRERVDPTRVSSGIWWFNGETPTLSSLYPTEADLATGLPATGTFRYTIARGTNILGINDGTSVTTSRTVRNDPTVKVTSLGPSSASNDVELRIEHTPPGTTRTNTYTTQLEVRAPNHLDLLGCSHAAEGAHGYKSTFRMKVFDNFGSEMPYIDANEDFTSGTLEPGVSREWHAPFLSRTKGHTLTLSDAVFHDNYTVSVTGGAPPASMSPHPSNPQTPPGNARVGTFTHWWFIGSPTPGRGVKVSEHIGILYADHGQYFGFLSPPFYVVRPINCP
ncbi:hypothetical protein CKA32_000478 [Geitlerinema sp. FC II]|nr:hypothetical protein CKA32_000478 [Geitlerinema sp. FC II]